MDGRRITKGDIDLVPENFTDAKGYSYSDPTTAMAKQGKLTLSNFDTKVADNYLVYSVLTLRVVAL